MSITDGPAGSARSSMRRCPPADRVVDGPVPGPGGAVVQAQLAELAGRPPARTTSSGSSASGSGSSTSCRATLSWNISSTPRRTQPWPKLTRDGRQISSPPWWPSMAWWKIGDPGLVPEDLAEEGRRVRRRRQGRRGGELCRVEGAGEVGRRDAQVDLEGGVGRLGDDAGQLDVEGLGAVDDDAAVGLHRLERRRQGAVARRLGEAAGAEIAHGERRQRADHGDPRAVLGRRARRCGRSRRSAAATAR